MIKIAVCVKQVPASKKTSMDENGNLQRSLSESCMNMYDYTALETALRIREQVGGTVDVFTMGPPSAESVLREAVAHGADEGILLSDKRFAGADVCATSYTLACGIRYSGVYSLILCGSKTTDGDTGQVGAEMAGQLSIPYIPNVCAVKEVDDQEILADTLMDRQIVCVKAQFPALMSVEPSISTVRIPTLSGRLKSRKKEISVLDAEKIQADPERIGQNGSATKVIKISKAKKEQKGNVWMPSETEVLDYIENRKDLWVK